MSNRDEDDAWRRIVDNYGERPEFPAPSGRDRQEDAAVEERPHEPDPVELSRSWTPAEVEEHFVPPEAPPVVPPRGKRGLAWFGLFGVPTLVLVSIMLKIDLPPLIGFVLFVWFVGGFGYLVVTMRKGNEDGWDDGAVV